MNWDILEGYVEALFDGIATGDFYAFEAKNKFRRAVNDFKKSYSIVTKQNFDNLRLKPTINPNELVDRYNTGDLKKEDLNQEEFLALVGYTEGYNTLKMILENKNE